MSTCGENPRDSCCGEFQQVALGDTCFCVWALRCGLSYSYEFLFLFLLQTPKPPFWKSAISDSFCMYKLSIFLFYTYFKQAFAF